MKTNDTKVDLLQEKIKTIYLSIYLFCVILTIKFCRRARQVILSSRALYIYPDKISYQNGTDIALHYSFRPQLAAGRRAIASQHGLHKIVMQATERMVAFSSPSRFIDVISKHLLNRNDTIKTKNKENEISPLQTRI